MRGVPLDLPSLLSPDGGGLPSKEWVSIATVDDSLPIEFDPELGPLVRVTTQPNQTQLVCRVGMRVAGRGEAEFFPFVAGDEVLVAILQGNARAGGVIVARLCNGIDRFPQTVAGQQTSGNNFAFTRSIAPQLDERSGPILWRQTTTGAFVSIGAEGNVTLRSGARGALQLSADALGMQSGDGKFLVQLDITNGRFSVVAGDAALVLSSSNASPERSAIVVPGSLAISTATNPAAEHAISTEAAVNLISTLLLQIGAAIPGPLTGAALVAAVPTLVPAIVAAASVAPLLPPTALAIVAAFQAATQKPPGVPLQGQLFPGIGCPGTFVG
jgi:hypothetical protein